MLRRDHLRGGGGARPQQPVRVEPAGQHRLRALPARLGHEQQRDVPPHHVAVQQRAQVRPHVDGLRRRRPREVRQQRRGRQRQRRRGPGRNRRRQRRRRAAMEVVNREAVLVAPPRRRAGRRRGEPRGRLVVRRAQVPRQGAAVARERRRLPPLRTAAPRAGRRGQDRVVDERPVQIDEHRLLLPQVPPQRRHVRREERDAEDAGLDDRHVRRGRRRRRRRRAVLAHQHDACNRLPQALVDEQGVNAAAPREAKLVLELLAAAALRLVVRQRLAPHVGGSRRRRARRLLVLALPPRHGALHAQVLVAVKAVGGRGDGPCRGGAAAAAAVALL
ncbi:hypothetical protein STCU_11302 [Strigomonas culicis]|uniref:Uncharacterized protein n=1 Tax=Strigomonas culicis TaxID=28005 RepID=S9THL8_9TRYP|nr:hypothetical protein STCU_11302 [Strigomonas culicis]|eukprot:EPY16409.1 hypothetical protein STCU_11302 [Strigomonas culicis]